MNKSGHIKDQASDDLGNRQFIVNCLGDNDQRKYFSISPFGIDFNAPENTRSLTADSTNKDVKYNLGVLNKIKVEDLEKGESAIFSTDETGAELVSKIVLRNTGDIEINKDLDNATILIGVDGSIKIESNAAWFEIDGDFDVTATGNVNVTADGNAVVTATQLDVNGGNLTVD